MSDSIFTDHNSVFRLAEFYVAPVIGCGNLPVCNRSTEDCSDIWTASVKVNMMSVSHTVSMGAKAIGLIKEKA